MPSINLNEIITFRKTMSVSIFIYHRTVLIYFLKINSLIIEILNFILSASTYYYINTVVDRNEYILREFAIFFFTNQLFRNWYYDILSFGFHCNYILL